MENFLFIELVVFFLMLVNIFLNVAFCNLKSDTMILCDEILIPFHDDHQTSCKNRHKMFWSKDVTSCC